MLLLLGAASSAAAQQSMLRGSVRTRDGQPAPYVSICLKNTAYGTQADENGNYLLRNVRAGAYTLVASLTGLQPQEKQIQLAANQSLTIDFELTENARQLAEVP